MVNESHEPLRFGELAVELGLITPACVEKALRIQAFRRERGQPVPWLGAILESLGFLSAKDTQRVFALLLEHAPRTAVATPLNPRQPSGPWPFRSAG